MEHENKITITGILTEDAKIHDGQYNTFGNFQITYPLLKKDSWGTIKGSTPHVAAIEKLRTAKKGDGIKIVGRLNEDHYQYMGKDIKTKKLHADELWVMKGVGMPTAEQPTAQPTVVSPQEPKPTVVATDAPEAGPPPHTAADAPESDQSGGQWQ